MISIYKIRLGYACVGAYGMHLDYRRHQSQKTSRESVKVQGADGGFLAYDNRCPMACWSFRKVSGYGKQTQQVWRA